MTTEDNLKLLKALGEETRYLIVKSLLKGEKCACQIPALIDRTQSNTSMHLSKLSDLGVVKSRRDGKTILYSIKDGRVCDVFRALGHKGNCLVKRNIK